MIVKIYTWFWKHVLHLNKPISWIIVDSIKSHLLVWQLIGSIITAILWTLAMHFIAMN